MIVIASELGSNLGHAVRQRQIAAALQQRGRAVSFLAPASSTAAQEPPSGKPLAYSINHDKLPLNCFADILLTYGFARRSVLTKRLSL